MRKFIEEMLSDGAKIRLKASLALYITVIFGAAQIVEVIKSQKLSMDFIIADVTLITAILGITEYSKIKRTEVSKQADGTEKTSEHSTT